jgi:hypothetical protein
MLHVVNIRIEKRLQLSRCRAINGYLNEWEWAMKVSDRSYLSARLSSTFHGPLHTTEDVSRIECDQWLRPQLPRI